MRARARAPRSVRSWPPGTSGRSPATRGWMWRRSRPAAARRAFPRPPLVRSGARLMARLRGARAAVRTRAVRRPGGASPGAPPPHRRLQRAGQRGVRPRDRGGRARLPARALPRRRWPRRAAHAHRPLRGRRRLPAADARSVVVSSILDALKKLEATEAPAPREFAVVPGRRRGLGRTAAGIALAFRAGAGLTFLLRGGRAPTPAPPPERV